MKVCFLGDAGSVHLHKWIKYFKGIGCDITVITFRPFTIEGVNVITIKDKHNVKENGGNFYYLRHVGEIRRIIKETNPDIVNAHYVTSYGLIGALTKSTKLVLTAWGSDILITPNKNIIYKALTKYALCKSDLITSDSEFMSKKISDITHNKVKIITVPMGVETELFHTEQGIVKSDFPKILSLRTLIQNSNIDVIIKAFKIIIKEYNHAKLEICNEGILKDELINLCKEEGIIDNVKFSGFVSRGDIINKLKENDFYISIPSSDATSVTLLEAMASGAYPIVSDLPANKEWIDDCKNGSITSNDANIIAETVIKVFKDINYRNSVKELNYGIIKKRANLEDNMAYVYDKFYQCIYGE